MDRKVSAEAIGRLQWLDPVAGLLERAVKGAATVVCPWHDSRFALADGHVIDGPATFAQPRYEARPRGYLSGSGGPRDARRGQTATGR